MVLWRVLLLVVSRLLSGNQLSGGLYDLYEIVPGILFATVAIVVVSLMSREPSEEITQEFDDVQRALA